MDFANYGGTFGKDRKINHTSLYADTQQSLLAAIVLSHVIQYKPLKMIDVELSTSISH